MSSHWTLPAFEAVARLLGSRTGLCFEPHRCDDAESGIRRAMAVAKIEDPNVYLGLLVSGELGLDGLIPEMTVGETYFLRDPQHFELLRREIIPEVLARRGQQHLVRCWSAGCASGEEAYSLAIVFHQVGVRSAGILGTDISTRSLARARRATYGQWSLRGVDPRVVDQHFRRVGDRWQLDARVARRVEFGRLNLVDTDAYAGIGAWGMDLILCRNVLIYFDRDAIARVARGFHAALAEGGWLITGPSDPALGQFAPFETVSTPTGIHYRRAPAVLDASQPIPSSVAADEPPSTIDSGALASLAIGATEHTLAVGDTEEESLLRVRALANEAGSESAERAIVEELLRHPLSAELEFLHAVLLHDLGRDEAAVIAVKRALYLDRSLPLAHGLLGAILRRQGDLAGSLRASEHAKRREAIP